MCKEGGFITVDVTELDGFTEKEKVRINVADISKLTLTTEGAYQINRDELQSGEFLVEQSDYGTEE